MRARLFTSAVQIVERAQSVFRHLKVMFEGMEINHTRATSPLKYPCMFMLVLLKDIFFLTNKPIDVDLLYFPICLSDFDQKLIHLQCVAEVTLVVLQ